MATVASGLSCAAFGGSFKRLVATHGVESARPSFSHSAFSQSAGSTLLRSLNPERAIAETSTIMEMDGGGYNKGTRKADGGNGLLHRASKYGFGGGLGLTIA